MSLIRSLLITACLLLSIGCNREQAKLEYLEKGNRFYAEGNYQDAALSYRKAIQKDIRFGEAHYRLGLAEIALGRPQRAVTPLLRAVTLMPEHEDSKVKLADIYLAQHTANPRGNFLEEVAALTKRILDKNANSFEGLRLSGRVAINKGDAAKATEMLEAANRVKPMNPEVVTALVQLRYQDGHSQAAEAMALQLIQKAPAFGPVYDVLYVEYMGAKRFADAEGILRKHVENRPKAADALLKLAGHYSQTKRPAEAKALIDRLVGNPTDFPQGFLLAGNFYSSMGNGDEAIRMYERGAQANPKDRQEYQKRISNVLLAQGKFKEAGTIVDTIIKSNPEDKDARAGRAELLADSRQPGDLDRAIADLQTLTRDYPENAQFRYSLARAYLRKGNLDAANLEFRESSRKDRNYILPRIALGEMSLKALQFTGALSLAKEILLIDPLDPRGRLLQAAALQGLGRTMETRTQLTALLKDFPQFRDAQLQLALLELAEQHYKVAEESLRKLHSEATGDSRALNGLVELFLAQNQPAKAVELVSQEVAKRPDSFDARLLLANTAARVGNAELAVSEYNTLISRNPHSEDLRLRLSEFYFQRGDPRKAAEIVSQALDRNPKSGSLLVLMGALVEASGQAEQARPYYRRALEADPQNPAAMNNLAYNLAEAGGDLDEALKLASAASKMTNGDPKFSDTLGWVYFKKNMQDSALQIFRNLVAKYPHDVTYRFHLAMTLEAKGDRSAARSELEAALARKPSADEERKIKMLLARVQ